jgi:hypothetical protein
MKNTTGMIMRPPVKKSMSTAARGIEAASASLYSFLEQDEPLGLLRIRIDNDPLPLAPGRFRIADLLAPGTVFVTERFDFTVRDAAVDAVPDAGCWLAPSQLTPLPSTGCPPPYNLSMPITRLNRGFHALQSALEQSGIAL